MGGVRNPLAVVRQTLRPAAFHGRGVRGGFFEGWYIKVVSMDQSAKWAFIPGVFRGMDADERTDEAFVQVLDGVTGESEYHRYDPGDFWAATDRFDVRVGPHRFTDRGFSIDFDHLHGDVTFTTPMDPWPVTWRRPGIMGPYAWVPLMECYHGVVSFGHGLSGGLVVDGPGSMDARSISMVVVATSRRTGVGRFLPATSGCIPLTWLKHRMRPWSHR